MTEPTRAAESVRWFQRRIDRLEAQVDSLANAVVDATKMADEKRTDRRSFRGMGHRVEHQDKCENCGLTGQAFAVSRDKGWPICCPVPQIDGPGSDHGGE